MIVLTLATALIGLAAAQRWIEAMIARRNAERLIADGAIDRSGGFYLVWMALQAGGLFLTAAAMDPDREPGWWAAACFATLLLGRTFLIAAYRRDWVARTLTTPAGGLIQPLPMQYRWCIHGAMALEAAALPLALGLPLIALGLGLSNAACVVYRLRSEASFASR